MTQEENINEWISKWISVEDRLPTKKDGDNYGFVITYSENDVLDIVKWNDIRELHTHWQSLPNPPINNL